MFRVISANLTDVGKTRVENQDYYGDFDPGGPLTPLGRLAIIADGVGGHRGGGLASRLAVDVLAEAYYRDDLTDTSLAGKLPGIDERLRSAFREANRRIYRRALDDSSLRGMASTCTAVVLEPRGVHVGHLGDSRAYLVRSAGIQRLTRDHSIVQERIDAGLIAPGEEKTQRDRNVITKSLGFEPEIEPDILDPPATIAAGDRIVLSTDGLHGLLTDQEIAETVLKLPPMEACEALVGEANARGGIDNITVQVLEIDRDE